MLEENDSDYSAALRTLISFLDTRFNASNLG